MVGRKTCCVFLFFFESQAEGGGGEGGVRNPCNPPLIRPWSCFLGCLSSAFAIGFPWVPCAFTTSQRSHFVQSTEFDGLSSFCLGTVQCVLMICVIMHTLSSPVLQFKYCRKPLPQGGGTTTTCIPCAFTTSQRSYFVDYSLTSHCGVISSLTGHPQEQGEEEEEV